MGTMLRLPPIGRYGSLIAYIAMAYERRDVVNTSSVELVENVPFSFCEQAGGPPCVLEPHEAICPTIESDIAASSTANQFLGDEIRLSNEEVTNSIAIRDLDFVARPIVGQRGLEQRTHVFEYRGAARDKAKKLIPFVIDVAAIGKAA